MPGRATSYFPSSLPFASQPRALAIRKSFGCDDKIAMLAWKHMHLIRRHRCFLKLYNQVKHDVYGFVLKRVNHQKEVAEDLVADIMMSAYESARDQLELTRTWIFTIARNRLVDHYRKKTSEYLPTHEIDSFLAEGELEKSSDVVITFEYLQMHISSLPNKQKTCLQHYYFDHLTTPEIADKLAISAAAVRQNLSRAINQLRAIAYEKQL